MRFVFKVEAEVEREQGKFASRDELEEQIQEALESANPSQLTGEAGGEYAIIDWEVSS